MKNQSLQPLHTCYDPKVYYLVSHPYVLYNVQQLSEDTLNLNNENTHSNMLVWKTESKEKKKTVKSTKTSQRKANQVK